MDLLPNKGEGSDSTDSPNPIGELVRRPPSLAAGRRVGMVTAESLFGSGPLGPILPAVVVLEGVLGVGPSEIVQPNPMDIRDPDTSRLDLFGGPLLEGSLSHQLCSPVSSSGEEI